MASTRLCSVADLEGGRILRPQVPAVVEPGGADVGMAQPLLDLGDVGLVLEGVGGGGGAQAVDAETFDRDAGGPGVGADQGIDALGTDPHPGPFPAQGQEQRRPGVHEVVSRGLQVAMDTLGGDRMEGQVAQLAALAVDAQVLEAAAVLEVVDGQAGGFLAAQAVIEQHGEQRPVAPALQAGRIGGVEQGAGLVVAEGRGLAFVRFELGPLDAVHRVAAGDGVALEQVVEQAGEGGELAADRGRGETALLQMLAPGEDMGAGHLAELLRCLQAEEGAEVFEVAPVGAAGARVVEVGEPLDGGRHPGEALELGGGEAAFAGDRQLTGPLLPFERLSHGGFPAGWASRRGAGRCRRARGPVRRPRAGPGAGLPVPGRGRRRVAGGASAARAR